MSIYEKARATMPKGRAVRFNDNEFVQRELTADEKKACKQFVPTQEEMEAALDHLCEAGYRISLKWDDYSSSQAAYIQHPDLKHENAGLVLSGRGSTPLRALRQAMYKHFVLFDGVWPRGTGAKSSEEFDD